MYLQYGNYQHAANEASVGITRQGVWSDAGILTGWREQWRISGFLQAADQESLTIAILALVQAYSIQGQDLGLYLDSGLLSSHYLLSAGTKAGTRVTEGPTFSQGEGAEYSTFRSYQITVEAESQIVVPGMLAFYETLNFQGTGGPRFVHLEPLDGLPVKQITHLSSVCRVTQQGEAIGQSTWPAPSPPIWPEALQQDRVQITRKSPKRMGPIGQPIYTEFPVTWNYSFESATPLSGLPNLWTG